MACQSEDDNEPTCSIKCMEGREKCASWRLCVCTSVHSCLQCYDIKEEVRKV
jgi:hypothetical protein